MSKVQQQWRSGEWDYDWKMKSLQQVGDEIGKTRMAICQTLKKGFRKMAEEVIGKCLNEDDYSPQQWRQMVDEMSLNPHFQETVALAIAQKYDYTQHFTQKPLRTIADGEPYESIQHLGGSLGDTPDDTDE